jgi:hypothetical protein
MSVSLSLDPLLSSIATIVGLLHNFFDVSLSLSTIILHHQASCRMDENTCGEKMDERARGKERKEGGLFSNVTKLPLF